MNDDSDSLNFGTYPFQDAVYQDYIAVLNGNMKRAGKLHMFFSPARIPLGLTDEEVRFCVDILYPIREALIAKEKKWRQQQLDAGHKDSITQLFELIWVYNADAHIPREFQPWWEPMTREKFKMGASKLLLQALTLLPS